MNRSAYLLFTVLTLLALALAGCNGDEEEAGSTPLETATAVTVPTDAPAGVASEPPTAAPTIAIEPTTPPVTDATAPAKASAPAPAATAPESTAAAQEQGQVQDAAAATAAAGAGPSGGAMAPWQDIMGVAVMNQAICGTLQGLAQTGQQGGLGALAVGAGLMGAGGVLGTTQQQLAGLSSTPGLGQLMGSLQADQTAMSGLISQWSGGQMDATAAGSALQGICGGADATMAQAQQSAQGAGLSQSQIGAIVEQARRNAGSSLGGLLP